MESDPNLIFSHWEYNGNTYDPGEIINLDDNTVLTGVYTDLRRNLWVKTKVMGINWSTAMNLMTDIGQDFIDSLDYPGFTE